MPASANPTGTPSTLRVKTRRKHRKTPNNASAAIGAIAAIEASRAGTSYQTYRVLVHTRYNFNRRTTRVSNQYSLRTSTHSTLNTYNAYVWYSINSSPSASDFQKIPAAIYMFYICIYMYKFPSGISEPRKYSRN